MTHDSNGEGGVFILVCICECVIGLDLVLTCVFRPKLSVIVVKKRMATRLFVRDERGFGNPPPGTVVDDGITKPMWLVFQMASFHFMLYLFFAYLFFCSLAVTVSHNSYLFSTRAAVKKQWLWNAY